MANGEIDVTFVRQGACSNTAGLIEERILSFEDKGLGVRLATAVGPRRLSLLRHELVAGSLVHTLCQESTISHFGVAS